MPKFFVFSDVHGFYYELKTALDEAGFNPENEDHWIISLGDEMDRGPEPEKVINYLMSLPRAIFIRGNHTDLMEELLEREYPHDYDYSNGTFQSVLDLAPNAWTFNEACVVAGQKVRPFFDREVNYFELQNHILVHSFIPLKCNDNYPPYYTKNREFEKDPDWRYAHASAWERARWGNPFDLAMDGFLPDKTLIFGHFHCSYPRAIFEYKPEFGDGSDFSIYYGNGYIGIDGCTVYSGKVNILTIKDDFIDD